MRSISFISYSVCSGMCYNGKQKTSPDYRAVFRRVTGPVIPLAQVGRGASILR